MIFLLILTAVVLGLVLCYAMWTKNYDYWARKGVPSIKPTFPYGNVKPLFDAKEDVTDFFTRLVKEFPDEPLIGFYSFCTPMLLVVDHNLIKQVMVKEFHKFPAQVMELGSGDRLLGGISFWQTTHEAWKELRTRFTPSFTTSKQKGMAPIMIESFDKYMTVYNNQTGKEITIPNMINLALRDAMLRIVFSIEVDLLTASADPKSEFYPLIEADIFTNQSNQHLTMVSSLFASWIHKVLNLRIISESKDEFYVKLVNSVVKQRKSSNEKRDDILQAIINIEKNRMETGLDGFTDIQWTSNMMTVMLDSTETIAVIMDLVLYMIVKHPEEQVRMRKEILKVGSSLKDFDYEKVTSLKRIEMVVMEALRVQTPIQLVGRISSEDTKLGDVVVEKGTKVFVGLAALHSDPKHHPEPEKFNPDRFLDQSLIHSCTLMPFGEGPRACLGQRYAQLALKVILIGILLQFDVSLERPISEERDKRSPFINVFKDPPTFVFTPLERL